MAKKHVMTASEMGKKSAEVRKKIHDSTYYAQLARKAHAARRAKDPKWGKKTKKKAQQAHKSLSDVLGL